MDWKHQQMEYVRVALPETKSDCEKDRSYCKGQQIITKIIKNNTAHTQLLAGNKTANEAAENQMPKKLIYISYLSYKALIFELKTSH